MEVCLVRHAIAEDRGARFPDDRQRPLTERGRARMREATVGIQQLFLPEVVVSSPLRRAIETAEILCDVLGLRKMEVHNGLATGDDDELIDFVNALGRERVALVGHEPHISMTLSYLLCGSPEGLRSVYKKGAAALVGFNGPVMPGAGALYWLMQPAALRAIGRCGESASGE
ncbi:MAG: histidine phosphatase family protein [Dehalococcoidia bacterium]|nr:histidine phosphatase family protein [Dehalococcoidia bacterium]